MPVIVSCFYPWGQAPHVWALTNQFILLAIINEYLSLTDLFSAIAV